MDTNRVLQDPRCDDEILHAHYSCLERPYACYRGVVYVGHMVPAPDGEEVEVFEPVPCRRSAAERR